MKAIRRHRDEEVGMSVDRQGKPPTGLLTLPSAQQNPFNPQASSLSHQTLESKTRVVECQSLGVADLWPMAVRR